MSELQATIRRSLLRRYLLVGYVLMIVYASLSPFSGWQEQGLDFLEVLSSPIGQTYTAFDAITNCLAYLPLGMLLALTLRTYVAGWRSLFITVIGAMLLSLLLEYLQMYLPSRISSNADVLTNTFGALVGGMLALVIAPAQWFVRATQWRIELFQRGHGVDFGLALLMLWMFAQINPTLPMLGNVFITEAAHRIFVAMPEEPFNPWSSVAVALNLLMIGLLLQTLLRVRRDAAIALMIVLCVIALAKFIAAAVLLKSWALMLWLNSEAMLGIVLGMLALWAMHSLPRVALLWGTALAALVYLMLALWVLDSGTPSAAMRLYHWRYGHLLNYNGMSQIVSSMFPLLLMGYLWRASRRRTK
ncbi:MAG: VanZ family protein [Gallionellaceae bacterium]|nr:MAG: VanZ family protein [Gallionellaceae bacterium]